MQRRSAFSITVVSALLALAPPAWAVWVVDAGGECVEQWTADSLAEGPITTADTPLPPLRYARGGIQELQQPAPRLVGVEQVGFKILYVPLAMISGMQSALRDMWFGLADTVTGGYFDISGDNPLRLTLQPEPLGTIDPSMSTAVREETRVDPCGRQMFPLAVSHDADSY